MSVPTSAPTEAETAELFDKCVEGTGMFRSYSEVPGTLTQPRPGQIDKGVRIDRILVPNEKLVALGWSHGVIGVELKPRGAKIGPAIAQALDYSRSVFTLPPSNILVHLSWVFVYPYPKQHGPVASILAQNRLGTADTDKWTMLGLWSGEANVLRQSWGEVTPRLGPASSGLKAGRR